MRLIFVLFFIAALVMSAQISIQDTAPLAVAVDPMSVKTHSCFGLGASAKACFSQNGNLLSFKSRDGHEHIAFGIIGEGYVIVYRNQGGQRQEVFDLAGQGSFGFGPATIKQPGGPNTTPLTITRKTLDGAILLTQVISTKDTIEGGILITMKLKNTAGYSLDNQFSACRFVDIDADMQKSGPFVSTNNSVVAVANKPSTGWPAPGSGMYVTALDSAITFIDSWQSQPFKCDQPMNTGDAVGFFNGDGIAEFRWNGGLAVGKQVSYRLMYGGK